MLRNSRIRNGNVDPMLLVSVGIVAAVVAASLFWTFCWVTIPKGHVGVVTTFGSVHSQPLTAGAHVVMPWNSVHRVSCQQQKDEEQATTTVQNGLSISMKATLLYSLKPDHAVAVTTSVEGNKYQELLITPWFKNAVRDITAEYPPEAFYSNDRQKIEARIKDRMIKELPAFEVEAVMLLDPILPQSVQERIQAKVSAEQDAIRMESVFKQRELEGKANKRVKELAAEAQVIEAKGIAESQAIIKKDLDDNYLRYLWVQALRENHGAVIYVPTGNDGMPIFKRIAEPDKK